MQLLTLVTAYAWYLYLVVPVFAVYKGGVFAYEKYRMFKALATMGPAALAGGADEDADDAAAGGAGAGACGGGKRMQWLWCRGGWASLLMPVRVVCVGLLRVALHPAAANAAAAKDKAALKKERQQARQAAIRKGR